MENKKVTKRVVLEMMLGVAEIQANADMLNYVNHELELLDKKNASATKSAKQKENDNIKDVIIELFKKDITAKYTIDEFRDKFATELNELGVVSNQKASALFTQLKRDNIIVRTEEKRKAYFSYNTEK